MQTPESLDSSLTLIPANAALPLDTAAQAEYAAAQPNVRSRIVNLLVGQAYAASPEPLRKSLIELLLRSVGVLGLVTIAGGVFARIRLRSPWTDIAVSVEDLREIRVPDVMALVDYVQRVSMGAISEVAHLLANSPALAGSGTVAVLASLMLRRRSDRVSTR